MNRNIDWSEIVQLVLNATGETLYMVLLAGIFTLLIGLPLGVLLFISRRGGLYPMPRLSKGLGGLVNLGRSLPFVVMLIALIPLTRLVVGTTLGSTAAVVPITIGTFPFFARIVENALDEVDSCDDSATVRGAFSACYRCVDRALEHTEVNPLAGQLLRCCTLIQRRSFTDCVSKNSKGCPCDER